LKPPVHDWKASRDFRLIIEILKHPERIMKTGWWYTQPSEKYEFVSWDDEIPT